MVVDVEAPSTILGNRRRGRDELVALLRVIWRDWPRIDFLNKPGFQVDVDNTVFTGT